MSRVTVSSRKAAEIELSYRRKGYEKRVNDKNCIILEKGNDKVRFSYSRYGITVEF